MYKPAIRYAHVGVFYAYTHTMHAYHAGYVCSRAVLSMYTYQKHRTFWWYRCICVGFAPISMPHISYIVGCVCPFTILCMHTNQKQYIVPCGVHVSPCLWRYAYMHTMHTIPCRIHVFSCSFMFASIPDIAYQVGFLHSRSTPVYGFLRTDMQCVA